MHLGRGWPTRRRPFWLGAQEPKNGRYFALGAPCLRIPPWAFHRPFYRKQPAGRASRDSRGLRRNDKGIVTGYQREQADGRCEKIPIPRMTSPPSFDPIESQGASSLPHRISIRRAMGALPLVGILVELMTTGKKDVTREDATFADWYLPPPKRLQHHTRIPSLCTN